MNVLIRSATQEDYNAICVLFAQGDHFHSQALPHIFRPIEGPARSVEFFASILASENAAIFVAEMHDTLIGIIHCDVHTTSTTIAIVVPRRYVSIESLVVDENVRQQGVGKALVDRVHQWARAKGITDIELSVWEFNSDARALYEKLGYQTTRRHMSKHLPRAPLHRKF